MKLQHFLSKQGVFSRRVSERMINDGFVLVNGQVQANPLHVVGHNDQVMLADKIDDYANQLGMILMHKPRGVWTNCKQGAGEKEVIDLLPKKYRHYSSIGRLDKDSEGLILFTNDGVYANQFLNAGNVHERVYHVWLKSPLTNKQQQQLMTGILLDHGPTKPCKVRQIKRGCYEFTLIEGKNRQIRRMVEWCGSHVTRLKRVSFGQHALAGIVAGQYRWVSLRDGFYNRAKPFLQTL